MKLLGRVEGSVCGAVLSGRLPQGSRGVSVAASRRQLCVAKDGSTNEPTGVRSEPSKSCSRSSQWLYSTFIQTPNTPRSTTSPRTIRARRSYSTESAAQTRVHYDTNERESERQDKDFLGSLVGGEAEGSVEDHLDFHRDPYLRRYAPAVTPAIHVSDRQNDVEYPSGESILRLDESKAHVLPQLCSAIAVCLRHRRQYRLSSIFDLYMQLPEPRMLHIPAPWRDRLLKIMGLPGKRNMDSMLRYFSLVADVKNAGITLRRAQWNFALAFASRYTARITWREMESTLRLWKMMETESNMQGNEVTFNLLFDVAAKAGNFVLAEKIYKEMQDRGFGFNRYHHVSLIHYFGLKLDSGGIRAAYQEMVFAGELIDTTVLNCVIAGLLRCGEEPEAEETYQRMRDNHAKAPTKPPQHYNTNKIVTQVLMMFSKVARQHPELQKSMQDHTTITPDLRTYQILIEHFAIRVGNLKKVAQYLDEMKYLKIPLHPTIFLALFKGFYLHGGFDGSDWSERRLEGVLTALYEAHDEHGHNFRIERWVMIWALRALHKCCPIEVVAGAYTDLSSRWSVEPEAEAFMDAFYTSLVNGRDRSSPSGRQVGEGGRF